MQDQPIDVDEESKEPASSLLALQKEPSSPIAAYQAVSPMMSTLPFLQTSTSTSTPATPRGLVEASVDRPIEHCCPLVRWPYRISVTYGSDRGHHVTACSAFL